MAEMQLFFYTLTWLRTAFQGPCSPNMIAIPGGRDLQRACNPCLAIATGQ